MITPSQEITNNTPRGDKKEADRRPWYYRLAPAARIVVLLFGPALLVWGLHTLFAAPPPKDAPPQPRNFDLPLPLPNELWQRPGEIAGLCALIAFLTSAILELLKVHFGIRARTHDRATERWLERRLLAESAVDKRVPASAESVLDNDAGTGVKSSLDKDPEVDAAREQIEDLCAAGNAGRDAFYDLPTKQFCGQIATAIDLIMLTPQSYPDIYAALTSGDSRHPTDVDEFSKVTTQSYEELAPDQKDKYDQLRAKISNYAQRALDGLQLEATKRWKRQLLFASIQVSFGISLATVMIVAPPSRSSWLMFFYSTAVVGLAGALLAPLAYDLTSAIRRLGR